MSVRFHCTAQRAVERAPRPRQREPVASRVSRGVVRHRDHRLLAPPAAAVGAPGERSERHLARRGLHLVLERPLAHRQPRRVPGIERIERAAPGRTARRGARRGGSVVVEQRGRAPLPWPREPRGSSCASPSPAADGRSATCARDRSRGRRVSTSATSSSRGPEGELGERAAACRAQRHRQLAACARRTSAARRRRCRSRAQSSAGSGSPARRAAARADQERDFDGAAEMRQIAAAEHAVPVGVVGLAAPEPLARREQPRVVAGARASALVHARARGGASSSTRRPTSGILDEEVPPEAAAQEPREALAVGQRGQAGRAPRRAPRPAAAGSAHSPISV